MVTGAADILPAWRILELATESEFVDAMGALYARLDERIAARTPVCVNRGDCCKFAQYKHRLYVTPVELAYFVATEQLPAEPFDDGVCPHQREGMCTVRTGRPMGCRVFFCELRSQFWQGDETEATLTEIKQLHTRFDVPYAYVEWLEALRCLSPA